MSYKPGTILYYTEDPTFRVKIISDTQAVVCNISEQDKMWWNIGEEYSMDEKRIRYFKVFDKDIPSIDTIIELLTKLEQKLNK